MGGKKKMAEMKRLHSTPGRLPPVLFSWQNIYDLACKVAFLVHFSGKFTPPPEGASDLKATQLSTPGLCLRCNPFNAPVKCLPLFAFAGDIFLWSDPWRWLKYSIWSICLIAQIMDHGNHIYFHKKCTSPVHGGILDGSHLGTLLLPSCPWAFAVECPGHAMPPLPQRPPVNLSFHFSFAAYFLALPLNAFLIGFKFPDEPLSKTRHKEEQNEIEFYY